MYQHARLSRPNPEFGYCLDDNARALMAAIRAQPLTGESGLLDYVRHYVAFVERCQRPDGRFRNFMAADGEWLEEVGSGDSQGRAIWALGFAAEQSPQTEVRIRALHCLDACLEWLAEAAEQHEPWFGLRSCAFALLGVKHWQQAEPGQQLDGLGRRLAVRLAEAYGGCAGAGWRWFEDELTYSNARLPEALIGTDCSQIGLESLEWLCQALEVDGRISLVGNRGWWRRGGERAVFDQQPVDAGALVSACVAAHRASGEPRFKRGAELAFGWFQGNNVTGQPMIDPDTGGCYDGLQADGPNLNQGAESLLAWLLAWEDMAEIGWA